MGAFNGVCVHSGYDLPFLPDPLMHLAHHRKSRVNFSLGLLDTLCGTADEGRLPEQLKHPRTAGDDEDEGEMDDESDEDTRTISSKKGKVTRSRVE